ncbi:MAG: FtsX-like permease family protein [Xanthomonadales bacterium]|nr:FtsX-like permease family protein [Gammaproteobacteria bacterium]MBT8053934.1 FtsX-like permease family protein [Gammaproteobacteria bacterium]NND58275.1 FtsX-like permease family protein [Xanthomonadales bacterium]NNK52014.1 FtsX-like permease family protein [Xanthomonadales bacterium]
MKTDARTTVWLAVKLLARDWRAGELTVLVTALLVAVTALTGVAFLTDRVGQAVEMRAAESLAADLRLSSNQPIDPDYAGLAARSGLETARVTSMPSVVFSGEANTLAAVRAVTAGYPLRGYLKTSNRLLSDVTQTDEVPGPGEAWASTRLMARLGVDTGAALEVGGAQLTLTRVLDFRPDEGWSFVDLAPTLLINDADLESTQLIQPGSRVSHQLLFAGSRSAVDRLKPLLQEQLKDSENLRDIGDTSPQIRSSMDRSGRFLNLASLVSVLLAAVAVAMAARRYSHRHRDRIALMKCMGASQRLIFRSSLLQLLMLALAGGVIGAFFGYLSQWGLAWLMRDFIGQALPAPGLQPVVLGLVTALSIMGGFALPDLAQMGKTPPLRVLRQDLDPPPLRYGISWLAGVAAVLGLLLWIMRDTRLVLSIFAGASATFVALGAAGWLLVKSLRGFRGAAGIAWRYGLANLSRRGKESVAQIVAFGLGLMVLLLLSTVRTQLMDTWRQSLPENAPNQFLINIQPHEVDAMAAFLAERQIEAPAFVPLVRARMTAINGEDVTQMTFEDPQGERWARRDSNLSWTSTLQADNRVVGGEFWQPEFIGSEVSVEQDFGQELGLSLGDSVAFDIAGENVTATVTSFRTVEWDSFSPNFFMVFSPGVLEPFPATYITSLYVEESGRDAVLDLMRNFPSVTAIDLDAVLSQVRDVMDKAALAVQAVFIFTLLAGVTVLWAAVQATRDERRYESAMLRTFGASKKRVLGGAATEFVAIGLLAGLLASAGATLAGYLLATRLFELDYTVSVTLWLAGPLAGMLFVGVSGMAATWRVITHAPVSVLRTA